MSKYLWGGCLLVAAFTFAACGGASTETETAANTEAAPAAEEVEEPVTGITAYWEMYELAHGWAADLSPLYLKSEPVEGVTIADGKAALWTALFVSPGQQEAREFTYRAISQGNTPKGVSPGPVRGWGGATKEAEPFQISQSTKDSSEAFATAAPDAGSWLTRNPGKPASLYLGKEARFAVPVWGVVWGTEKDGYSAIVNSRTGALEKP